MGEARNLRKRDRAGVFSNSAKREAVGRHRAGQRNHHAHADEPFWGTRGVGGSGNLSCVGCGELRDRHDLTSRRRGIGERGQSIGNHDAFLAFSEPLAVATAFTNSRAAAVIFSKLPSRKAAASTRSAPTPNANAPAAMNSAALAAFTPPVGIREEPGNGAFRDLRYFGPPTFPQGKILTRPAPWSCAFISSDGVSAPGIASLALARATESTEAARPGLTKN